MSAMIEIAGLSKWYGPTQVLKDCSAQVAKGEVVVVCGPSGSGKSTLIKCVNGLEPFQEGRISVDGVSVGDLEVYRVPGRLVETSESRMQALKSFRQFADGPCVVDGERLFPLPHHVARRSEI